MAGGCDKPARDCSRTSRFACWVAAGAWLLAPATSAPAPAPNDTPVLVGLAIDTSGSIPSADLEAVRDLLTTTLRRLPAGSEAAVFTFDDESRLVLPRTADEDAIRRAIAGARAAGRHTALNDALYDVSRYLTGATRTRRAVLLLTDGRDENSALNLEDGLAVAQRAGVPVYAVGVGRPDDRVLRRIAKLTGGAYLVGAERSAENLATSLRRLPVPSPEPAVATGTPGTADTAAGRGAAAASPATPAAAAPPRSTRLTLPTVFAMVAILVGIGILGLLVWRARRGEAHACATCGRPLPGPLSECTHCARDARRTQQIARPPELATAAAAPAGGPGTAGRFVPDLSPTVLERLNMTEEYLDKTVTLRDRPVLVVSAGSNVGQVYDLSFDSAISVGRSRANDVILSDVAVSSQHCRVRPEGDSFEVVDLKSTNGTWVNEHRIDRQRLAEGDRVRVGDTTLEFRHQHRYD